MSWRCHRRRVSRLPEQDEPDDAWRDGPGDPWGEGWRGVAGDVTDVPDTSDDLHDDVRPPMPPASPPQDRLASVSGLMASVSTAYTAAHGHPLAHDGLVARQVRRRRWSVAIRAAVVASLALALVTGVVVVRDLARTSGAPVPLAEVDPTAGAGAEGSADVPASTETPSTETAATETASTDESAAAESLSATAPASSASVAVHVVGQVTSPGVVEVAAGARVIDAITAAGGLTEAADSGAVNLARPVVDGEQIYVPVPGETIPAQAQAQAQAPVAAPSTGTTPGAASKPAASNGIAINLNTADAVALDALPGIGPAIAGRIIDWREAHGAFAAVDDLLEVSGIGPAVLAKIRDQVTV